MGCPAGDGVGTGGGDRGRLLEIQQEDLFAEDGFEFGANGQTSYALDFGRKARWNGL